MTTATKSHRPVRHPRTTVVQVGGAFLRRTVAAFVLGGIVAPSVVMMSPTLAWAQPAPATDAKAALAEGDKAAKNKDWPGAIRNYEAANKAAASSEALDGLANAYYQSGRFGEAHGSYTEWVNLYGTKVPAKKAAAQARLKELEGKTGAVTVTVSEPGAAVFVDDKQIGVSPLAGPVRMSSGPHRVRVTKDGYIPFDQVPNVSTGGTSTVDVKLVASTNKARLVVKEKSGKPIRIIVDNVDMGDAPWSGEVEPGQHDIAARGIGLAAAPQKVTVERGKTQEIELVASNASAPVKIGTSDGKGLIYLDDKLVGEGSFVSDIPAGPHKLKITREGYDPFEEEILIKDKDPIARTITLKISSKIETGPMQETERLEGLYGGFSLLAMFTPGGTGNDVEKRLCEGNKPAELVSCEAPDGFGGGLGGFVGYHWDPVGIELFVAGQYDDRVMKTDWNAASTDPGIGPDPARTEEYTLRRAGVMGAFRARLTLQGQKIRATFALGAGVVRRILFLERETLAKNNADRDIYVSETTGYWSPVVTFEPAVGYRLTKGVTVAAGLQVFLDAPATFMSGNPKNENPRTSKDSTPHTLGGRGLATSPFDLASNLQIYVGPFLGMMFGP